MGQHMPVALGPLSQRPVHEDVFHAAIDADGLGSVSRPSKLRGNSDLVRALLELHSPTLAGESGRPPLDTGDSEGSLNLAAACYGWRPRLVMQSSYTLPAGLTFAG